MLKCVAAVAALGGLLVPAPPSKAQCPLAAVEHAAWAGPCETPAAVPRTVDVMLGPGGVLMGQAVSSEDPAGGAAVAGRTVVLLRAAETVATTVTDVRGEFTFRNLRGGRYRVLVSTAEGPCWRLCRLWTAGAAPPHASHRLTVLVSPGLVRGQLPLPIGRLPRAATVVAIAAGAIVPPIIYHGVKRDDYIPASR